VGPQLGRVTQCALYREHSRLLPRSQQHMVRMGDSSLFALEQQPCSDTAARSVGRAVPGTIKTQLRNAIEQLPVQHPIGRTHPAGRHCQGIARRLAAECEVYADELDCLRRLDEAGHAHATLHTGGGRAATEEPLPAGQCGAGQPHAAISGVHRAIG